MTQLSPHFSLAELTVTSTGYLNIPNERERENLEYTAGQLELVREACGNRPVTVTSGYRADKVNRAVGGSNTSDHKTGFSADIKIAGMKALDIVRAVLKAEIVFDQIILYPGQTRVHIGFGPRRRGQLLRQVGGGYLPLKL